MIPPGFSPCRMLRLAESGSTQDEARNHAIAPWQAPLWISARIQTHGRGRRGREWASAPGNLAATWLHLLPGPRSRLALLGFALGLAVSETLERDFGVPDIKLKWPNDLLIGGAKLGGILLESWVADGSGETEGPFWLAAGIGLNLASAPDLDGYRTGSVSGHVASAPDPDSMLNALAPRFAGWSEILWRDGFAPLATAWTRVAAGLGETVTVDPGAGQIKGRLRGLDADGALRLEVEDGTVLAIAAGDVIVPQSALLPAALA